MYARVASEFDANKCVAFIDSLFTTMQVDPPIVFPRVVEGGVVAHRTQAYLGADGLYYVGFDSFATAFLAQAISTDQIDGILDRAGLNAAWLAVIEALLALEITEIPQEEV